MQQLWQVSCDRPAEFDAALLAKDREIALLCQMLSGRSPPSPVSVAEEGTSTPAHTKQPHRGLGQPKTRKGKAPPVELFTGEDPEIRVDDWLPSFRRAALWNGWSSEEQLIQLAGHLKGWALQEWNLLSVDQLQTYEDATEALRGK